MIRAYPSWPGLFNRWVRDSAKLDDVIRIKYMWASPTIFYNTSNSGQIWFCRKPFQILTLLFYLNHQSLVSNLLLCSFTAVLCYTFRLVYWYSIYIRNRFLLCLFNTTFTLLNILLLDFCEYVGKVEARGLLELWKLLNME